MASISLIKNKFKTFIPKMCEVGKTLFSFGLDFRKLYKTYKFHKENTYKTSGRLPEPRPKQRMRFEQPGPCVSLYKDIVGVPVIKVNNLPVNILPIGYSSQTHGQSSYSPDDLPKTCIMNLSQASMANVKGPTTVGVFPGGNTSMGAATVADRMAAVSAMAGANVDNRNLIDVKPKLPDEPADKPKIWKLSEISEPSQCRSLRLPDSISATRGPTTVGVFPGGNTSMGAATVADRMAAVSAMAGVNVDNSVVCVLEPLESEGQLGL